MNAKFPLAITAGLIADPARAAMLMALLDGRPKSAGELARAAEISAQSASMHLAQLLQGNFLTVRQEGRHRYYCLTRPEIAHAVESLGAISTSQKYKPSGASEELCYARTCYDYLAGQLAVRMAASMERQHLLVAHGQRDYEVTTKGASFLSELHIDVEALRNGRRRFARRCLDWTERQDHLAGALGAAICERILELRWVSRSKRSRAVHVSNIGARELARLFV